MEISLGKVNILLSIPATSTISVLSHDGALDFGSMSYLIRRRPSPNSLSMQLLSPMELSSVQTQSSRFGGPITSDGQSPDPPLELT